MVQQRSAHQRMGPEGGTDACKHPLSSPSIRSPKVVRAVDFETVPRCGSANTPGSGSTQEKGDQIMPSDGTRYGERLSAAAHRAMERAAEMFTTLQTTFQTGGLSLTLYNAGIKQGHPWFGLFPRDLFSTAFMLKDMRLLSDTVLFSAHTIGSRRDPRSGEEPGRVLHEYNRVERDGLLSHYNAAETSHLMLIGARLLLNANAVPDSFWHPLEGELRAAGEYVLRHVERGRFEENPRFCGAKRYFAMATYWKDSHLPGHKTIEYPVCYTLVQAQTIAALRALAELEAAFALGFSQGILQQTVDQLVAVLTSDLWDAAANLPLIALDRDVRIGGVSSDGLHMLAYLEPGDLPRSSLEGILAASGDLETDYGYRSYAPGQIDYASDAYHLGSIWPYEQILIAEGALRFGLPSIARKAFRTLAALDELEAFPELLIWDQGRLTGGGCDQQLWSCAVPGGIVRLLEEYRTVLMSRETLGDTR